MNKIYVHADNYSIQRAENNLKGLVSSIEIIQYYEGKFMFKRLGFHPSCQIIFNEDIEISKIEEVAMDLYEKGHFVASEIKGTVQKYRTHPPEGIMCRFDE